MCTIHTRTMYTKETNGPCLGCHRRQDGDAFWRSFDPKIPTFFFVGKTSQTLPSHACNQQHRHNNNNNNNKTENGAWVSTMTTETTPTTPKGSSLKTGPLSVDVTLSRPFYRIGSTVVGTVRFVPVHPRTPRGDAVPLSPRELLKDAKLYLVGRCRIDPRWQNPERYQSETLYGKTHPNLRDTSIEAIEKQIRPSDAVSFWATNVVDLLSAPERRSGRWSDHKPKPLVRPPATPELYFSKSRSIQFGVTKTNAGSKEDSGVGVDADANDNSNDNGNAGDATDSGSLEDRQLAFTFRADLPLGLPHTAAETSCRYSYSVIVLAKQVGGKVRCNAGVPFRLNAYLYLCLHFAPSLLNQEP